jgi:putative transposase
LKNKNLLKGDVPPMAYPAACSITPTQAEQTALSSIVNKHASSQQLVQRVRIIQAAAAGDSNTTIAINLRTTRTTVRLWRNRWVALTPERTTAATDSTDSKALEHCIIRQLQDAPRSGAPQTFTPEQVVRITAVACEKPADSNRPISHWSNRELADEAMKRKIVPAISERQVGRFLKRSQPQTA